MLLAQALRLAALVATAEAGCKVLWDGRVPVSARPDDFTKSTSLYNPQFVLGENQTWAEVIKLVPAPPTLFDVPTTHPRALTKPILTTITDESIFYPSPDAPQLGFRRSELIPAPNTGSDFTVLGTTTVHFSIRTDPSHPLNYSHEYHPVWHERNDFNGSHFDLETGTPFDASKESIQILNPKTLRIAGWSIPTPEQNVFITEFDDDIWHNFALEIGWDTNRTTVYYSKGYMPLRKVAGPFENDNSDGGQFHFGIFKLPTGPKGIDVVHEGFQEHIHLYEGLFFGGVFIEDSSDGCVTLS